MDESVKRLLTLHHQFHFKFLILGHCHQFQCNITLYSVIHFWILLLLDFEGKKRVFGSLNWCL